VESVGDNYVPEVGYVQSLSYHANSNPMANSPFLSGQAKWIWVPDFYDTAAAGQFVYFRRTFELQKLPNGDAPLHVSADTRYQLYLNGHRLSWGQCKSYEAIWNYETVNITPFLVQGTNVLAAHVLRFSSTFPGCLSMIRTPFPGLIVHCDLPDGSSLHTDEGWKAAKDVDTQLAGESEWDYRLGPPFLNLNERVDGRLRARDWLKPSFDDSSWPSAIERTIRRKMAPMLDPRRLFPREIPALSEEKCRFDAIVTCTGSVPEEAWRGLVSRDDPVVIPPPTRNILSISSPRYALSGSSRCPCQPSISHLTRKTGLDHGLSRLGMQLGQRRRKLSHHRDPLC
jgi:alpha-L-rhamnosidase